MNDVKNKSIIIGIVTVIAVLCLGIISRRLGSEQGGNAANSNREGVNTSMAPSLGALVRIGA